MNTFAGRRHIDLAYAAYLFIIPVIFYWATWGMCNVMVDNPLEGDLLMRSVIPRTMLGLPIHLVIFLITAISLFFSVSAKLRRRTRWYKTPLRIRLAITLGMFLIFLQILM